MPPPIPADARCLEAFYPKLNPGAVIVADNMLGPVAHVKPEGRRPCHAPGPPDRACPPAGSRIKTGRFEPD